MNNNDYYNMIFKRKSFHLFRDCGVLAEDQLDALREELERLVPLDPSIKTEALIVSGDKTSSKNGAGHFVLFYSEKKGDYHRNIGYMGQQLDLFCAKNNIASCWCGIGAPEELVHNGLDYVIMIALGTAEESQFRKNMFKAKRKDLSEVWSGDALPLGEYSVAEIARFSPSACNSQPWRIVNEDGVLSLFRCQKPGRVGIIRSDKIVPMNRIDIGIYMFILETCLQQAGYTFDRELMADEDEQPCPFGDGPKRSCASIWGRSCWTKEPLSEERADGDQWFRPHGNAELEIGGTITPCPNWDKRTDPVSQIKVAEYRLKNN